MAVKLFCRLIIVFSAFIQSMSSYNIKAPLMESDLRINLIVNLTKHCVPDIKASVLITDSPSNSLSHDLYTGMTQSVSFLDKSENYSIPTNQNTPVPWIIFVLTSPMNIKDVLTNETWRDFNQFLIILDGGDTNNGCVNAQSFLMEAWKNDILNVVFVCLDHQNQVPKLFSFNPFTSSAPKSWKKVSVIPAINGHPWTLLRRNYDPDAGCRKIFFNKVSDLGGYKLKTGYFLLPPFVDFKIVNGIKVVSGRDDEIIQLLMNKLNARLVYENQEVEYRRQITNDTRLSFIWEQLDNKKIDLMTNAIYLRILARKSELMYPFDSTLITIVTKHRELTALGGQMFTFLPLSIAALFLVISIFIFMLLSYVFKDPYSRNFIDILRVYLNLPLPRSPISTHGRIVFGMTLVSFTVANIIIQSEMNTVMTSKNIARNVENIQDLNELNYTVLASEHFLIDKVKAAGVNNVVLIPKNFNCLQLKNNEAIVSTETIIHSITAKECYIPNQPILTGALVSYYTRRNFQIFSKFNHNFFILFESGIMSYQLKLVETDNHFDPQDPDQYQMITMKHMEYVFYAYVILNFVSLIVFFIELYISHD